MGHKPLLLFWGTIMALCSRSQNVPDVYNFPDSIIKKEEMRPGITSQNLSTSGYYQLALEWEDKQDNRISSQTDNETVLPENALAQITRLAKDARVVIINEGHNLPNTRSFVLQVLQALKPLGFNSYGAETFMWHDPELAMRKYPVDTTGYYTQEPVYGELVREALKMGYTLFPYEDSIQYTSRKVMLDTLGSFMVIYPELGDTARMIINPKGGGMWHTGKKAEYREINQAKNIMSYLRAHPNAKAVIHVGYGHLCRDSYMMGFHLDTALHEKIVSIEQERFREHSDTAFEEPFYRRHHFSDYTAFADPANKPLTPAQGSWCYVDVCVASPRTQYINGRPDWLYKMPGRKAFTTNRFNKIKAPSVLIAYYAAEYEASQQHAIPIDVLELTGPANNPPLLLRSGRFTVIQIGEHGGKKRYDVKME